MSPDHLFLKCLEFVREQSSGEWGEAIEESDAKSMATFIAKLPLSDETATATIGGLRGEVVNLLGIIKSVCPEYLDGEVCIRARAALNPQEARND